MRARGNEQKAMPVVRRGLSQSVRDSSRPYTISVPGHDAVQLVALDDCTDVDHLRALREMCVTKYFCQPAKPHKKTRGRSSRRSYNKIARVLQTTGQAQELFVACFKARIPNPDTRGERGVVVTVFKRRADPQSVVGYFFGYRALQSYAIPM